jgi:hypothetical protein
VFVGERDDEDLVDAGLVRLVGQEAAVGGEERFLLGGRGLDERVRVGPCGLQRQDPDVEARFAGGLGVGQVFAVGADVVGALVGAAGDQQLLLA